MQIPFYKLKIEKFLIFVILSMSGIMARADIVCSSATMSNFPGPVDLLANNGYFFSNRGRLNLTCRTVGPARRSTYLLQLNPASYWPLKSLPGIEFRISDLNYERRDGVGCWSFDHFVTQSNWQYKIIDIRPDSTPCTYVFAYTATFKFADRTKPISGTVQSSLTAANVSGNYSSIIFYAAQGLRPIISADFPAPVVIAPKICTLAVTNTSVTLPPVVRSQLDSAGSTAGDTPFSLSLSGCTYPSFSYNVLATWAFTPGTASNVIRNSASSASNVQVQLLDSSGKAISNGQTVPFATILAPGNASANFTARYFAPSAATAGKVTGIATVTLNYS
jgi:major type 1 subunit fimbrin (pilin)